MNISSIRLRTFTIAMAVGALAIGGCSSADSESVTTTQGGATAVEITATDFAFMGMPTSVEAGTKFELTNSSDAELHEFVAILLPEDETRSVEEIMALPPEEVAALFGGVQTVLLAPPGADGFAAVGDGALWEPGRYAIICAIPTGADPDEYIAAAAESEGPPEVAGGPPHFVNGMFAELEVSE